MKKIQNNTHLEGYLFGHSLEQRKTGENAKSPNTPYINGTLDIATDDQGLNVVPVRFTYVTEKFKSGKTNATYGTLQKIIETDKTWQNVGNEALKLKVDTALGVNDFYNAESELVTYKINDGGFAHIVSSLGENRNSFEVDVLITGVTVREADEEAGRANDVVIVKGATFNFMNSLLPVEFVVKDPAGMKWFENLEVSASEPLFMKVWGNIICTTVDSQVVEESAFGEASVKTTSRRLREWVITGASTEPYDFGDEAVLTKKEVEEAIAAREDRLAEMKKEREEYLASKNAATASPKAKDFAF